MCIWPREAGSSLGTGATFTSSDHNGVELGLMSVSRGSLKSDPSSITRGDEPPVPTQASPSGRLQRQVALTITQTSRVEQLVPKACGRLSP